MSIRVETIEVEPGVTVARAYTSVGAYPLLYISERERLLCPACALEEQDEVIVANGVNWESYLTCDECCDEIEMAYPPEEITAYLREQR